MGEWSMTPNSPSFDSDRFIQGGALRPTKVAFFAVRINKR